MSASRSIAWDLGNAPKQSITEVLQNPRGNALQLPDFDLSAATALALSSPTPPTRVPDPLNINHFEDYLRRYAPLHAEFEQERHRIHQSSPAPDHPADPHAPVPDIYFHPDFSVAAHRHLAALQPAAAHTPSPPFPPAQVAALRATLSSHRASLQLQLRARLAAQSPQITAALSRVRALRADLRATADAVRLTRTRAAALVPAVADAVRAVRAVSAVQADVRALRDAVASVQRVLRAPDDVRVLLQTGEFAAAIHAVHAAKGALAHRDLAPVVALAPARARLAQAVEAIDTALRDEFRNALRAGEPQGETLREVVELVALMGRLPLLRGFFLKEIKTELAKELKVVDALYAACNEVKISAEQALTLITIIRNYRQADADEEEDVSALLRDVHDDFEEMLASAVDRFLGSFKMSHETGLSAGFVVITPMELLTEQTCFDEFKAALKFGEQVRSLEEAATQLEAMFSLEKRSSLLRAKISERHNAFLSSFHRAHIETLTRTVKADKWQETRSPKGALRLLASLVDDGSGKEDAQLHESGNRIEQAPNGVLAPQPRDGLDGTVVIGEATFKTVTSGIRYLRSVCAYTLLAEKSPRLASEIARKATEFSRLFNSLVGKAILGAAALQWSGLRSITARHLSLASRTVAMAAALADRIDKPLAKALSASQVGVVLPLIQRAEKDLRDHHGQLLAKILTIMMDRLEAHEAVLKSLPWEKFMEMKRFDMPSAYITTLVKEATVLHRILWSILPTTEVCDIFTRVCAAYGSHLTEAYSSLDGGKEWVRSRVAEDVSCMHDRLLLLDVFKTNPDAFGPVRKLYTRFAKELQESAPNKQGNSKTGRSFIRSQQDQTDKPSAVKLLKPADRTTDAKTEEAAKQPKHPLSSKDNANSGDFLTPAKPQDVSKASLKTEDARESPGKAGIADGSIPDARAEEKVEDDKLQARNEESENSSTSAVAEPANNSSPDAGAEEKVHHKESQARNEDLGNISNGVAEPAKISNLLDSEVQSEDKGMVAGEQFGSDDETQTKCASIVVDEKPLLQSAGSPSQHVAESRTPYDESESKSRTTTLSAEQRQLNEVMGLPDGGVSDETKMETREQEDVTELTTNDTKIVSNGRPLEPSPAQVPEGDLLGLGDDDPNTAGR